MNFSDVLIIIVIIKNKNKIRRSIFILIKCLFQLNFVKKVKLILNDFQTF